MLILLTFFESLKVVLINMVAILMMSARPSEIKLFWNKGYEVMISVHDVINKSFSRDSKYIVDVIMWPKFGNLQSLVRIWPIWPVEKPIFLKCALVSSSVGSFSTLKINDEDNKTVKFVLANMILVAYIAGFKANFTTYVPVFGNFSAVVLSS